MTLTELVQSKMPARYLGAKFTWRFAVNADLMVVKVEGMPRDESIILTGVELYANGVSITSASEGA